jgi:hypothetical protein
MKKSKALSNSSKIDYNMSIGKLSYATSGNDGGTSKKLSSLKNRDKEQNEGYATINNSLREENKLDVASKDQKNPTIKFDYNDNITFESIFHGG